MSGLGSTQVVQFSVPARRRGDEPEDEATGAKDAKTSGTFWAAIPTPVRRQPPTVPESGAATLSPRRQLQRVPYRRPAAFCRLPGTASTSCIRDFPQSPGDGTASLWSPRRAALKRNDDLFLCAIPLDASARSAGWTARRSPLVRGNQLEHSTTNGDLGRSGLLWGCARG
jgi:hypothetical protein